jgi:GT2 family glycosyltransferase
MTDLSIIILTYNQWDLTKQTLESVQDCMSEGKLSIQTIVTDNGSNEPIVDLVKNNFPWVEVIDNKENLGFSAGNNRGALHARGKYVLFLNSDTKLFSGVLPFIVDQFEQDSNLGIATCRVELENGSLDPASHRGFPTPWRALTYYGGLEKVALRLKELFGMNSFVHKALEIFGGYHLLDENLEEQHEIDACTGAFLMLRRELGEELSWWDEQFFMYGEDLDLCYRVKEKGLNVMFFPQVKITHFKHSSGLKVKHDVSHTDEERELRKITKRKTTEAFYEAMKLFYFKHYSCVYHWSIQQIVFAGIEFKKKRALSRI